MTPESRVGPGGIPGTIRHLLTQLSALALGRGGAGLLSGLWLVAAARVLSPNDFGNLTILLAVGAMGGVLGDLGLQTTLSHATAQHAVIDRRALRTVITRRLMMSTAAIAVVVTLYGAASTGSSILIPLVFAGSIVGSAIYSSETAALTAVGWAQVDGLNEFLSRLAVFGAGWWWLHHGGGLLAAVAVYVLADISSAVVVSVITWRHLGSASVPVDLAQFRLRRTAKLAFALTAAVVYARVDTWLLGQFRGAAAAGHYAAADKVLDAVLLVPAAIGALSIAQVTPLALPERWRRITFLFLIAIVTATIPAIGLSLVAPQFMGGVFGDGFRSSGPVLVLLLASAAPGAVVAAGSPITAVLTGWGFTAAVLAGLVFNIGLNLALIPAFGADGAAIANLASELALAVWLFLIVRRASRSPHPVP